MGYIACFSGGLQPAPRFYDSLVFDGSSYITLPYSMNADYSIYCDFTTNGYIKNQSVFGNDAAVNWLYFTQFDNKWYYPTGLNTEGNFSGELTGRHKVLFDDTGIYFDSVQKGPFTPTTASDQTHLIIAGRPISYGVNLKGKIHEFKIMSITTGNILADYKPALYVDMFVGLYDIVNKKFVLAGTGTHLEDPTIS